MVNKYMLLLVASVVVASLSQILLKKSAVKTYSSVIREYLNPYVIAGYGMMVLSTLLTVGGYAGLEYCTSFSYVLLRLIRFCFFLPAAPPKTDGIDGSYRRLSFICR